VGSLIVSAFVKGASWTTQKPFPVVHFFLSICHNRAVCSSFIRVKEMSGDDDLTLLSPDPRLVIYLSCKLRAWPACNRRGLYTPN